MTAFAISTGCTVILNPIEIKKTSNPGSELTRVFRCIALELLDGLFLRLGQCPDQFFLAACGKDVSL